MRIALFRLFQSRPHDGAFVHGNFVFVHQKLDALQSGLVGIAALIVARRLVVAADDLLPRRSSGHFVVADGESRHVDAHIGRRTVQIFVARDLGQNGAHDGETFHVAVVIDGGHAVRFQMIWIDHIDVPEIRRRRLVRHVDGVAQGKAPYRKGFEFCITRPDAALVLVIQLRKAGGEFAAPRPRRGDDDERARGFDIRVGAVALVGDDDVHLRGIALGLVMDIRLDAVAVQFVDKVVRSGLVCVLGDDDAVDQKPQRADLIH